MTVTEALDPAVAGPASRNALENKQACLSNAVDQLAGLRFSIVLSARWESSGSLSGDARTELQDDLRQLRSRYSSKIDEIAMNYGVQAAMAAQERVEREITVPKNMALPAGRQTRRPA
jgi:conjugal transfer/entry exclusion protein